MLLFYNVLPLWLMIRTDGADTGCARRKQEESAVSLAQRQEEARVLLTINSKLGGIVSRQDAVERRQQQGEACTPRDGVL